VAVVLVLLAGCGAVSPIVGSDVTPWAIDGPLTASVTAVRLTTTTTAPVPPRPVTAPGGFLVLPRADLTPGTTNPAVIPATIGSTICVAGWTATVRPPTSVTNPIKIERIAA
jgi:hypothetical protein